MASGEILRLPAPSSQSDVRVRAFADILTRTPVSEVESSLSRSGLTPLPSDVPSVLRLSYSHPASAVKFFRWSGLHSPHLPLSWNLIVDLLGRNALFEPMWDAIRSMKHSSHLSTSTFSSAFSSYCAANKIKEAVMTFDVMDRYNVKQDVLAVNSLLSAICSQTNLTSEAAAFFDRIKTNIPPDSDTFAILLEGWEKEGNVARAKNTFGEMVIRVGWNANNMSAYDAFLNTLVKGGQPGEALNFLKVMKGKNCLPGLKFFANALDVLVKDNDMRHAIELWDLMVNDSGLVPNLVMYNAVIALVCNNRNVEVAYTFLDSMPYHGTFADGLTYDTIFECLVRVRRVREAKKFFGEMRRNEMVPSAVNCAAAVKMFCEEYDPLTAVEVWKCVVEERVRPEEDCANELVVGLSGLGRLSEVRRYAEDMIEKGIELSSVTMGKLKNAFCKGRKEDTFERIEKLARRRSERL